MCLIDQLLFTLSLSCVPGLQLTRSVWGVNNAITTHSSGVAVPRVDLASPLSPSSLSPLSSLCLSVYILPY